MSKRVKKGKNAQKKKQRKSLAQGTRSSNVSVAQQREMYEEEVPRAEIGEGVKARAKGGTTMSLGVRILVGVMAFTMLTMMGVVSYSSMNDFDIIEWLTGEDVYPGTSSETSSASAMSAAQRSAMDATNKFDGFFVVDEDSGLTLTDVNSDLQTADTIAVTTRYKAEADEKRDEILEDGKKRIERLEERKDEWDEAKRNNPVSKFTSGLEDFRNAIVTLFTNTYNGLTGENRLEEDDIDISDTTLEGEVGEVESDLADDYNVDEAAIADEGSDESLAETLAEANDLPTSSDSDGAGSLADDLAAASGTATE